MRPTIVTHRRPHLDEICALWIIQKYWPQFEDADIEFVNTGPTGGDLWNDIPPDTHPLVIYVGVGHSRFDEHKGDTDDSAATLVWRETKAKYSVRKGDAEMIDRIVAYVKKEDMGGYLTAADREFALPTILNGLYGTLKRDSLAVYEVGRKIMEALAFETMKQLSVERDWEGRVEFNTPWGLGAAVITDVPGIDRLAYQKGFALVVTHNKARTYHGFRASPDSGADLTEQYLKVQQLEPHAPWFLHQSKRLLLCGGDIADAGVYSELTLDQLVDLVKVN